MLGLGAGPVFLGWASDFFAGRAFAGLVSGGDFAVTCQGADMASLAAEVAGACGAASAEGIQFAMVTASLGLLWAAAHYLRAARSLRDEVVSPYLEGKATPVGPD
jgi:hypothetical protein